MQTIIIFVGIIIILASVFMIYDARCIAEKNFNSNEINESAKILKIVGFILSTIGMFMIILCK